MDELASAAKVAQVITCVSGIVGQRQDALDNVVIHIGHAVEGIDKHRVAVRLRNVKADETKGGNN
tara:strand:+ start:242 stop:436 length:195 start_codon:yes stop_codon:yes gene_type:complete